MSSGHPEPSDRWRPPFPAALWSVLDARWGPVRRLAVDLGAGSGATSRELAARFERVIAVEPDPRVADWAQVPDNVQRLLRRARETSFDSGTVDAVTVASALHWMDVDTVLPAVGRWLREDGLLAAWRMEMPVFHGAVGVLVDAELAERWQVHRHPRLRTPGWTTRTIERCPQLRVEEAREVTKPCGTDAAEVARFLRSIGFVQAYARTGDAQAYLDDLEARVLAAAAGAPVTGALRFEVVLARPAR